MPSAISAWGRGTLRPAVSSITRETMSTIRSKLMVNGWALTTEQMLMNPNGITMDFARGTEHLNILCLFNLNMNIDHIRLHHKPMFGQIQSWSYEREALADFNKAMEKWMKPRGDIRSNAIVTFLKNDWQLTEAKLSEGYMDGDVTLVRGDSTVKLKFIPTTAFINVKARNGVQAYSFHSDSMDSYIQQIAQTAQAA